MFIIIVYSNYLLKCLIACELFLPIGPVDCSVDGYFPDPANCSGFIVCSAGVAYPRSCPPGLKYNKIRKYCDWPQNVQC